MTIGEGLAAELALLTEALDVPGTDVAETLTRLGADARTAVASYLGLSVVIAANRSEIDLTILEEGTKAEHVLTSLLVPLSATDGEASAASVAASASVELTLYAATPGAFVDLAADLSWITGRALSDFRLDEHRVLPERYANAAFFAGTSTINQALGVLIGRGSTPDQAERELYGRAVMVGIDLVEAAFLILAALTPRPESEHL